MTPYLIGFAAWIGLILFLAIRAQVRERRRMTGAFDSVSSTVGFEPRSVTPKPAANVADVAQRKVPILSAFARFTQALSFPGMAGTRDGVNVTVWEAQPDGTKSTQYLTSIEIEGPAFIIRNGKLMGALPGDYAIGSKEPPITQVGTSAFMRSFTVRCDHEVAISDYLTPDRQQAINALLGRWSGIEISNHTIELRTGKRFSDDPAEADHRIREIAALATLLSA